MQDYNLYDLIQLEARIYAIERYIKEHDSEGDWYLSQEYHKFLPVVASRHGGSEEVRRSLQDKQRFEQTCRDQNIEVKTP